MEKRFRAVEGRGHRDFLPHGFRDIGFGAAAFNGVEDRFYGCTRTSYFRMPAGMRGELQDLPHV